jgi:transposase
MATWEDLVTMSLKEAPRAGLVQAALAGRISNLQGAQALSLSIRQFQRLKRRVARAGPRALVHGRRGRPSPRAVPAELRARVVALLQHTYYDFNDCHATEKLREVEGVRLCRETIRRIRRALGQPPKHRRRPRRGRLRRTPAAQMGALVLLDGSDFAWLGPRGPVMSLLGAIDDATGTVLALLFRPAEDLHGYLTLLAQLAARYGLPLALYGDRLNVFVRNDAHWTLEEQLAGRQHPTHFGYLLRTLGVRYIAARSPQAKGRVERLWQTMQDRLVVELRLRRLATPAAAEAYLPDFLADYNRRFTHPPAAATALWRRAPRPFAELLSCQYLRRVARDNTVHLGLRWVQLPAARSYAGCRVEVRECLDGRLLVDYHGQRLATQPPPGPDFVLRPRHLTGSERRRLGHPAPAPARSRQAARPRRDRSAPARPARARPGPPQPTHPWRRPYNARLLRRKGMTVSRRS